mgnify:CR=1 FL=1
MSNSIVISNVSKTYRDAGRKVNALSGVTLDVPRGDYISLVGPSGAGKSTLLNIIAGLDNATSGSVIIDGMDLVGMKGFQRFALRNKKIGYVFQFYHLIQELTALENVLLPAYVGSRSLKKPRQRACELLASLGLEERLHFYPYALSGGEQQRVALARALINDPEILLCDEPTGNLDSEATNHIRSLLRELNEKEHRTIVMVTHNLELARDARCVLIIKNGRLGSDSVA